MTILQPGRPELVRADAMRLEGRTAPPSGRAGRRNPDFDATDYARALRPARQAQDAIIRAIFPGWSELPRR